MLGSREVIEVQERLLEPFEIRDGVPACAAALGQDQTGTGLAGELLAKVARRLRQPRY